jgi:hypothetical protein
MFELTQETKDAVVAYLIQTGVVKEDVTTEQLEVALDGVVAIVKKQFGF